ncbi:MAG: trypsin-like peptidase domain-containing protein [Planctomycetota bacterium]
MKTGVWSVLLLGILACVPGVRAQEDALADEGVRQLQAMEAATRRAVARAQPSVVSIFLLERTEGIANFAVGQNRVSPFLRDQVNDPDSQAFRPNVFGSGIVVERPGLILTCYHVIRPALQEGRFEILVRDASGNKHEARLFAADPRSDLATLELVSPPESLPPPIKIGDGSSLFIGQSILAIGNPYGVAASDGSTSVSRGIVSNVRRRPAGSTVPSMNEDLTIDSYGTLVQTDARLNMGVSGGAIINIQGELVGITMALAAAMGYETPGGFAMPTDALTRRVISTLAEGREMEYGFLGIEPGTITARQAEAEGMLPVDGTRVVNIKPFLPAYLAGLKQNDIITSINGKPVKNNNDLVLAVGSLPVGTVVDAEVVRGKSRVQLKLPLAKFPLRGQVYVTNRRPLWNGIRVDHLSILLRDFSFSDDPFSEMSSGGVVISEVETNSPAAEKGLQTRMVITRVNGEPIHWPDEFDKKVAAATGPVRLQIARGEEIELPPPSAPEAPAAEKP